jgi:NIMA (never in mitosis gene a)-related kinase
MVCSGGDLCDYLQKRKLSKKPLSEDEILTFFVQLCLGLKHMHDRKILHRDIKTKNVFLAEHESTVVLGDMGISKVLEFTGQCANTAIGSPYYLSPEIYKGTSYDTGTDIWSLGCILYELATFKPPFNGTNVQSKLRGILCGLNAFP